MNRRHFFGMTLAAVAAAGLPALVLPERKIFLPPPGGWFQSPFVMREIRQYLINNDSFPMRYDVAWGAQQWHVDFPELPWNLEKTDPTLFAELIDNQRRIAREQFEQIRQQNGYRRADVRVPSLPRGLPENVMDENGIIARYV